MCVKERERVALGPASWLQIRSHASVKSHSWLMTTETKENYSFPFGSGNGSFVDGPTHSGFCIRGPGVGQHGPSTSPSFKANQYDCWVVWSGLELVWPYNLGVVGSSPSFVGHILYFEYSMCPTVRLWLKLSWVVLLHNVAPGSDGNLRGFQ